MAKEPTAATGRHETWPEYVLRVTSGVPRKDIAAAADINVSGVSRWLTGTTSRPSAEKVVAFARGLNLNPVEALVAAGYLEAAEIGASEVIRSRTQLSDEELIAEVADRLRSAGRAVARNELQDSGGHPTTWLPDDPPVRKDTGVIGHEEGKKRNQSGR